MYFRTSALKGPASYSVKLVCTGSAIIVNPTHFAVALKYDVGEVGAPKVLAMGRGKIAEKIISLGGRL